MITEMYIMLDLCKYHKHILSSAFINYLFSFENLAKTETKVQFKEATENKNNI